MYFRSNSAAYANVYVDLSFLQTHICVTYSVWIRRSRNDFISRLKYNHGTRSYKDMPVHLSTCTSYDLNAFT